MWLPCITELQLVSTIGSIATIMISEAIVGTSLSRPKIHRLPASVLGRRDPLAANQKAIAASVAVLGVLTIIAYMADKLIYRNNDQPAQEKQVQAAAPEIPEEVPDETLVTPDIAQLAPSSAVRQVQTIVITGQDEGIVGQMAKIPGRNAQIGEIESVSGIDNRTGPELLGIVNKY